MAKTEQSTTRVAKAVLGDLDQARTTSADEILPKGGPGASSTTRAATIAHVRALWPYPELRAQLFQRMVPASQGPDGQMYPARNGLEHWNDLIRASFPLGYPEPPPMLGGWAPAPADLGGY